MEKPRKMTTRQYVGLVRDLNARMAQMPPLFQESQQLECSELVDSLAIKAPRSHQYMLISQGFNPDTRYLETFVEHCEQAETTDNIAGEKFAASDEDSKTKRKKNSLKFKGQDEQGKKLQKSIPSCIALFLVKTPATPPGSEKSSRRKSSKSLSIPQRITRVSPGK